ncbi:ABC transporter ATP-binding protein [Reyranella sp.]|uniref:ABC transporter ATP-binding protein n=1 Tax=Reyranella sp. TaxID=1929291 RepID=UPI003C7C3D59
MSPSALLEIEGLKKHFPVRGRLFNRSTDSVKAVDGVSLSVRKGETLGLVGESGCGKSTLGRCLLRLEEPTSGSIVFDGQDLLTLDRPAMRRLRRDMQIIFQDPYSSLNPRKAVGGIIGEAFRVHGLHKGAARRRKVEELLALVGLRPEHYDRFPHEFSGGQRQRIGIARALALDPKFIVADEAVSALDVSIQAQILNLLVSLQRRLGLTYVFISHNLGVVRHVSDRVGVMYLGKIVELAPTGALFAAPAHPYTEALLSAVPRTRVATATTRIILAGDPPSPLRPPSGCAFHPRCPHRQDICARETPPLHNITPDRAVACHFPLHASATTTPAAAA